MVAIRYSHQLEPNNFELSSWCASLNMSPVTFEQIHNAWSYAQEKLDTDYSLMWYGIEMVEVLHGLNMDDDSLVAAMLFSSGKTQCDRLGAIKRRFQ